MQSEQVLINIMFQIAMMQHSGELKPKSREDLAEWIREQLYQNGFETEPQGSSWAVIKSITTIDRSANLKTEDK